MFIIQCSLIVIKVVFCSSTRSTNCAENIPLKNIQGYAFNALFLIHFSRMMGFIKSVLILNM